MNKKKHLTTQERYELMKHMDSDRDYCSRVGVRQLAKELSKKLCFQISEYQVHKARVDLGIEAALITYSFNGSHGKMLLKVCSAIVDLYSRLGEEVPEDLKLIVEKYC